MENKISNKMPIYKFIQQLTVFHSNVIISFPGDKNYIGTGKTVMLQDKNKIYAYKNGIFELISDTASY